MVRHLVLLKFKAGTSDEKAADVLKLIGDLRKVIPGITGYESGKYASPEGLNKGFTHGFVMTFETPAHRDAYLPHPDHERVKAEALKVVEDVIAFDFQV